MYSIYAVSPGFVTWRKFRRQSELGKDLCAEPRGGEGERWEEEGLSSPAADGYIYPGKYIKSCYTPAKLAGRGHTLTRSQEKLLQMRYAFMYIV